MGFLSSGLEKRKLLGQVSTPKWIADFMVSLCINKASDRGIDPCFGNGVFLHSMAERFMRLGAERKHLGGNINCVEIDPTIFYAAIKEFRERFSTDPQSHLLNFFDYVPDDTFDFAVMNPPYVRHDLLNSGLFPPNARKSHIFERFSKRFGGYLSQNSNLYVYFFLHLTDMLRDGGTLVAITYNSWLYSRYGKHLQRFFLDNFKIRYVIDFDKEAFEDALIGSCIVVLEKAKGEEKKDARDDNTVCFARLRAKLPVDGLVKCLQTGDLLNTISKNYIKQARLYQEDKWEKFLFIPDFHEKLASNVNLVPLRELAHVSRGNGVGPLKALLSKTPRTSSLPLLKNPRRLNGKFKTSESNPDAFVSGPKSRLKPPGELVFSYIIRGNKRFYLNDAKYATTDNFHNIVPSVDKHALFAILNSSLTRYFIETSGRTQGSGLLKLQVYELKELPVPNLRKASPIVRRKLSALGKQLSNSSKNQARTTRDIDRLVFGLIQARRALPIVKRSEKELMMNRLKRKETAFG